MSVLLRTQFPSKCTTLSPLLIVEFHVFRMSKKRELQDDSLEGETPPKKKTCVNCWIPPANLDGHASPNDTLHTSASSKRLAYNGHPDTLPKLPEIFDKSLETATFTHQGTLGAHEVNNVDKSYERLEFLGDAYLELIATRLIFLRFHDLAPGQLSQRRQLLVNNQTLTDLSLAYGFDKRARLPNDVQSSHSQGQAPRKIWIKTMGDIFEAYVAAVILSDPTNGFSRAEAWMTELWEPLLVNREEKALNMNAKVQLGARVMGKGIKLFYRDEKKPERLKAEGKVLFHIGVYITGWGYQDAHLGSGEGWNKNEAGNRAAAQALLAPLTTEIAAIKQKFDAEKAEERKQTQLV